MILTAVMLLGLFAGVFPSRVYAATASQNNIVARADYLYNIKWTAKSTVYGWNGNYAFYAGSSYRIPYGQPINSGYYIGYGVSVDDFVKAANTAGSIYYTSRSTYYDGGSSSVYFATDCSALCPGAGVSAEKPPVPSPRYLHTSVWPPLPTPIVCSSATA